MKKLLNTLCISLFAAIPLLAEQKPVTTDENEPKKEEITSTQDETMEDVKPAPVLEEIVQ